ncbi:hypothetical protein M1O14_04000 [Dehalococcoidia bacterium]|nr:hypothetical protein [Dehalococcoidia bacterium]
MVNTLSVQHGWQRTFRRSREITTGILHTVEITLTDDRHSDTENSAGMGMVLIYDGE